MVPSGIFPSEQHPKHFLVAIIFLALLACSPVSSAADSAFVRVNQARYETGMSDRAYLMSTAAETEQQFKVISSERGGGVCGENRAALLGTWSHSKTVTYEVYAGFYSAGRRHLQHHGVGSSSGRVRRILRWIPRRGCIPACLLKYAFSFTKVSETGRTLTSECMLRTAPGHLKDENATVYDTASTGRQRLS